MTATLRTRVVRPGLLVHEVPEPANVELDGDACAFHLVLTAYHGDVTGELWRWVADDGEVGYEVRIEGLDDSAGVADVVTYTPEQLGSLMAVCMDLRVEWCSIRGDWPDRPALSF